MMCPVGCASNLVMTERQGVEIDYCPTCRGVWLDRGELDKIIERAGTQVSVSPGPMAPSPPRGYDDRGDDRRGAAPKKKKRSSFLEDMFDFGG